MKVCRDRDEWEVSFRGGRECRICLYRLKSFTMFSTLNAFSYLLRVPLNFIGKLGSTIIIIINKTTKIFKKMG